MNFWASIEKLSAVTRAKDWRLSFVPFIIGCVYLWFFILDIHFSSNSVVLFVLSLMTTAGFASLGYFINEFFDKEADRKAGKLNKLAYLKGWQQGAILVVSLALTFLPWLWLPMDKVSMGLIGLEVGLFLVYSLPFPRLKTVPVVSGFIDAAYAYVVPLVLSFYTYTLFAGQEVQPFIVFFALSVFFIGFRNITIHHVNDVFYDQLSGTETLPQRLGPQRTNLLILLLGLYEVLFLIIALVLMAQIHEYLWIYVISYILFILIWIFVLHRGSFDKDVTGRANERSGNEYASIEPVRHLTDPVYQIWFPLVSLIFLMILDIRWIFLVPLQFLVLTPASIFIELKKHLVHSYFWTLNKILIPIKHLISLMINYSIYFVFKLFGVDLRKEKVSAIEFIKQIISK